MRKYDHKVIEKKWQETWEKNGLYRPDLQKSDKKFYNLFMFPYPSAEGLHAGHAFSSSGGDVYGRFMRMNGHTVFQPMGYDSFGIHSENYAIKVGESPQTMLSRTTAHYEAQLRSLGHGYDWSRTVTTSDPHYYKWTQWLFVELFNAGLAYRKEAQVNWCPSCKTVLADEQVIDGKCERCGTEVSKKSLAQWFLKITDYADRLLENLDKINWTEKVKTAQRNWIGKAEGLEISFPIVKSENSIVVWTRYWETIFGTTFLVVSPEYLVANFSETATDDSIRYAQHAMEKTADARRTTKEKTGVNTGIMATNPATGEEITVWVADYVIEGVGTGAVMGVPSHDERDFTFAKKYDLPLRQVVSYSDSELNAAVESGARASENTGALMNSEQFDGLSSSGEGKTATRKWLTEKGIASVRTNYHLRDWLISRQRYWGAPIPMIYCESCAKAGKGQVEASHWESAGWYSVAEADLPVMLPEISDYKPKGEGKGPLASHPEFFEVACPACGEKATRETDVMDTFMDSSWYFLRYPTVGLENEQDVPFDPEITKQWLPVDFYLGGAEHSVLHLMYARFVTQVLYDLKHISFDEPFPHFYAHGLMIKDGAKMSKSRGNVVNPDIYIEKFGADTMRLYLMFMGPMDGSPDFRDTGIEGMERFLKRVVTLYEAESPKTSSTAVVSKLHKTIQKVTDDMYGLRYNTAIAAIMELVNFLKEADSNDVGQDTLTTLLQLLAPFTPHITEEIWHEQFGNSDSIHTSVWPLFDEAKLIQESVVIAVQVNGKLRGQVEIEDQEKENEEYVKEKAFSDENIKKWLNEGEVKKIIFIKGKLLNVVL